jgi:hypothetical protein
VDQKCHPHKEYKGKKGIAQNDGRQPTEAEERDVEGPERQRYIPVTNKVKPIHKVDYKD